MAEQTLGADDVSTALAALPGWAGDPTAIRRTVVLPSFLAAIDVVTEVAAVAEELDHHPDIDIRWRTLTFECSSHDANGVTGRDITLAARIDEVIDAV